MLTRWTAATISASRRRRFSENRSIITIIRWICWGWCGAAFWKSPSGGEDCGESRADALELEEDLSGNNDAKLLTFTFWERISALDNLQSGRKWAVLTFFGVAAEVHLSTWSCHIVANDWYRREVFGYEQGERPAGHLDLRTDLSLLSGRSQMRGSSNRDSLKFGLVTNWGDLFVNRLSQRGFLKELKR